MNISSFIYMSNHNLPNMRRFLGMIQSGMVTLYPNWSLDTVWGYEQGLMLITQNTSKKAWFIESLSITSVYFDFDKLGLHVAEPTELFHVLHEFNPFLDSIVFCCIGGAFRNAALFECESRLTSIVTHQSRNYVLNYRKKQRNHCGIIFMSDYCGPG